MAILRKTYSECNGGNSFYYRAILYRLNMDSKVHVWKFLSLHCTEFRHGLFVCLSRDDCPQKYGSGFTCQNETLSNGDFIYGKISAHVCVSIIRRKISQKAEKYYSKNTFIKNKAPKGDVETSLKSVNLRSLHIFRPSLLLGERKEFRFGEKLAAKASGIVNTIMVGPFRPYKAIEAKKVARAMAIAAESDATGVYTYPSHEIERIANQK
ncbi:hypothetical protein RCG19_13805 [Neobacillus sp. OS1-2]|uniref:hypothetical protein n=1 Tax=Neobacillus sp. OS1-2 TaxID=3070680 RepID=UPI0027E03E4B|nr:hypothetical protein [Neobacillus sp. OS1-2]WML42309.1 hypothetical protein RCG19_13805 [Neobacillus sp. OS1-2]